MSISLIGILVAFAGGAMGAIFSSLFAFVFVALIIAGGMGLAGNPETLGNFGFGAFGFWAPHISFSGGAFASAYAAWKKYKHPAGNPVASQDITTALISLKKPDVILAGGVGGLLGYLSYVLWAVTPLKNWMDSVPFAVVMVALIAKVVFDGSVFGKTPDDIKAVGGRFNVNCPRVWLPYCCTGTEKLLVGTVMGLGGAWAVTTLARFGIDHPEFAPEIIAAVTSKAAFIPFMVAVFSLIGFYFGMAVVPNHHIVYCAALGVLFLGNPTETPGTAILWGTAMGALAMFAADFGARAFNLYGNKIGSVHFDPPTAGIWLVSILVMICFNFHLFGGGLDIAVPVILFVFMAALAVVDHVKLKKA